MLSSLRLDGSAGGSEAGPSTLRWPSGQPINPINLSTLNSDSQAALSSRASRHFEKAVVLPTPEPLPAQLEPVGQWLDKFTFVNLDRTGASQLAQSIPELAGQVDHPKLDAALLELLARIAKLSIIPVSANARDDDGLEAAELLERDRFLQAAPVLLELALALAQALSLPEGGGALPTATTGARAELVVAFGPFTDRHAPFWSANPERSAAKLCALLLVPSTNHRLPILRHILAKSLPPLFKPHPKLNPETGRVLSRPLGGDRGMSDWYDEDESGRGWRSRPGLAGVVRIVVENLETKELEAEWPLVLPPLLSFLDDYSAPNKLAGNAILDELLERVEPSLLVRTGVGKVFEKSISAAFSCLGDACGPKLLTAAIATSIKLIDKLHPLITATHKPSNKPSTPSPALPLSRRSSPPPPSPAHLASLTRFNALSALFAASIIHTWQFHGANRPIEEATCAALPPLLKAFEGPSGVVRFLPALVPHLSALVELPGLGLEGTVELRTRAAEALVVCVREAEKTGRMGRWRPRVLGAVGRGWCAVRDGGEDGTAEPEGVQAFEEALREIVRVARASGDGHADVERLLALDPSLFRTLAGPTETEP